MEKTERISPVLPRERFITLDLLRGVAVLGILIMNIQSYAMIEAAYINPTAYGDLTGLNKWIWILSHIFADQKFMTIFSILFGAGIILITERAELKGVSAARLHYRRTLWLLIIGIVHAYLLWHGDILVVYGLCAIVVFLFRKLSPTKLLIIGFVSIAISSLLYLFFGWTVQFWPPEAIQDTMVSWKPGPEIVANEVTAYQGSWLKQMVHRVPTAFQFQTFIFLIWSGWRAGGLMLIGMALYKWGVLTGKLSNKIYQRGIILGFLIGFPAIIYGLFKNFHENFSLEYSMFIGGQFNYWGSLFVSAGYICLIMLITKTIHNNNVFSPFAQVGRMAFTNYLLQTIICTTIFYGHGFGLFGQIERKYQILIVFGIWIFLVIITNIWLRYFRFGPVEWLWRSLTYLKLQKFRES